MCRFYLLYLFCAVIKGVIGNYTFTYQMASQCKEHVCKYGYEYKTFYRVDSEDRRSIPADAGVAFQMHIAILAASNGHILLSAVPHPGSGDSVYEIVVGGGGNKFTELRRNLRRNAKDSSKTVGVLSPVEFRPFYIKIGTDGLVEFGREGQAAILRYYDVDPIPVQYFSFAAWNGVEAKFLYDCPISTNESSSTDSKEVEPKMSSSDKLKVTLMQDRLPHLPPGPKVTIRIGLKVTRVRYDPFSSELETGIAVVVSWTDPSMAWNPDKFDNVTTLTFRQGQIWRPTFFVFNAHDKGDVDAQNPSPITMVNSGEATFHFHAQLHTFCFEYTKTVNKWPHDEYQCAVVMGPWEAHEKITIEQISLDDEKMTIFSGIDDVIPNEWQLKWKQGVVSPSSWQSVFTPNDNDTYQSDKYIVNIALRRKATAYNIVFYTPLIVLVIFILMSFWAEPLQMSRVWFYAGSTIVICLGLCYIDYLIPCHTVPTILILYTSVLIAILISLMIQVLLMTEVAKQICKSPLVYNVVTAKLFRMIFCLPEMKTCRNYDMINEAYAQEDDDSGVIVAPRNGNIEEMETDKVVYGEREELAAAIDKIMFVAYSVTFAILLLLHF